MEAATAGFISQEALDEYASHAEEAADLGGQPGRIRGATIFSWLVFAVAAVPSIISAQSLSHSLNSVFILTFAGPFAFFGLMVGLSMLRTDLLIPSIRDRSRPDLALRCFLRTIAQQDWTRASSIVAPIAIGEPLLRAANSTLNIKGETLRFREPQDLQRYWSPVLAYGEGFYRRLSRLKLRETRTEGPLHYYRAELQVRLFPSWAMVLLRLGLWPVLPLILLTTQRHTIVCEMPVVKHKSQWWLASAGVAAYEEKGASECSLPGARTIEAH